MNKQQMGVVTVNNDQLSVHGQRVRNQPQPFWLYYSENVGIAYKISCRIFIIL